MASRTQFLFKPVKAAPALPSQEFIIANQVIPKDVILEILEKMRLNGFAKELLKLATVNKVFRDLINYILNDEFHNLQMAHILTQRWVLQSSKKFSNFFVSRFPRMLTEETREAEDQQCDFFIFKGSYAAFVLVFVLVGIMNYQHCGELKIYDLDKDVYTCTDEDYISFLGNFSRMILFLGIMLTPYLSMKILLKMVEIDKTLPLAIEEKNEQIINQLDNLEIVPKLKGKPGPYLG